ncbi:FecR family protein [Phocaeicola sp.]
MIKQDFHIANLIAQYISGEITEEQTAELTSWRKESSAHEILFQKICDEENLKQHIRQSTSFNPTSGWAEVEKRIRKDKNKSRYIKILSYAAVIMLPIIFVGISMKFKSPFPHEQILVAQSILPGESKAILTLDNGKTINLDKKASDLLEQIDGTNIQVDSTMLNYQLAQKSTKEKEPIYNKVETPRGGEYALLLSDGTKVHLNAMSSLRFPVTFAKGTREVELEGEAFFEVSKTGEPFIVNMNGMQVEVLGTTFNISAYPNEEYQTTLVTGSVKVNTETGESCILKPSQQASVTLGNNSIQVRTVDAEFYTSWVKGKIHFKDQRLEDIMKTLSRWYDMEVIYANEKIKDIRFGCNVDRYTEITPFVRLLERTEKVHVKVNGKTITFYN